MANSHTQRITQERQSGPGPGPLQSEPQEGFIHATSSYLEHCRPKAAHSTGQRRELGESAKTKRYGKRK